MSILDYNYIPPVKTGSYLVSFEPGVDPEQQKEILQKVSGTSIKTLSINPTGKRSRRETDTIDYSDTIYFDGLNIGYTPSLGTNADAQVSATRSAQPGSPEASLNMDGVRAIEDETFVYATSTPGYSDLPSRTWGLDALGLPGSGLTGAGIKVAVLDAGFDKNHPDYASRNIAAANFSTSSTTNDVQGHGTHCVGTAVGHGFLTPSGFLQYGVASGADIFIGKVLGDNGSGRIVDVINGIRWAIAMKCEVISMSLGSGVQPGGGYSQAYETVAQAALDSGSLIIAAAGNDSQRSGGYIAPVGSPANCPSIMAVAALDQNLNVADFSCGDVNLMGGSAIDIAAPGVSIFSSYPYPKPQYARLSGTSMACPHVAGVAAMLAEKTPDHRGRALWRALIDTARPLPLPASDVGAGLVQIP